MDALETLVADTLREHAADAPTVVPEIRPRPQRRWLYAAAAALLVAGLAVAVVTLRGGAKSPPATGLPDGYRWLSYHGITVAVPEDLPVVISTCGPYRNSVMVDDEVGHGCFNGLTGPSIDTVVYLTTPEAESEYARLANEAVTIDGVPAQRGERAGRSGRITAGAVRIDRLDVVVAVTALNRPAVVQNVLDSIRITPVDAAGCPDRRPATFDKQERAQPTSVSVCEYASSRWLVASWRADPARIRALTQSVMGVPDLRYTVYVGRFRYADGSERVVQLLEP